ncbi:MAG: hypothetical protein DBY32_00710 [Phascolarctobacterium sp.]|nr:MAG: hypothetical protein DBY32_00710 [Phascolarctobacterium sp.]
MQPPAGGLFFIRVSVKFKYIAAVKFLAFYYILYNFVTLFAKVHKKLRFLLTETGFGDKFHNISLFYF